MLGALRMPAVITLADAVHWMLLAAAFATALGVIAYLSARYHVAVMRLSEKTAALHDEQVRLEAVAEKLATSEAQFRLLAENSSDVIMRLARDGGVLWVSPSVTPVLGWLPADCSGRDASEFFASEDGRAHFHRDIAAALEGQTIVLRAQLLTKAHEARWVEIHAGPCRTSEGRIDSIVASFRAVETEVAAERALERRASTDELTRLLNRKEAFERIDSLNHRAGVKTAVLLCDIDRFKLVNDTFGHATGDDVLEILAERIRGCLRSTDDVGARIGGDELLILLSGVRDLHDAATIAETLRQRAAEPMSTTAGSVGITVSIGVTLAHPAESADTIVARADDAMYRAKNSGRNRVVVSVGNTVEST
jgi:diguanylate cyclase (GGDEF)-like protein/PAS domain S-box-containing protein